MSIQTFNKTDYICACHKFLQRSLLSDINNELLPNGDLTVVCEIFYCYGSISTVGLPTNNNIDESLNLLLGNIADCVIKVRDSKIKVHKCILASR
uniref:BTB domain-containing protein n=1 Tax=Strongyloides venezuelensis TaxID=75913 RepID=A0A0K0FGF1_STRVS